MASVPCSRELLLADFLKGVDSFLYMKSQYLTTFGSCVKMVRTDVAPLQVVFHGALYYTACGVPVFANLPSVHHTATIRDVDVGWNLEIRRTKFGGVIFSIIPSMKLVALPCFTSRIRVTYSYHLQYTYTIPYTHTHTHTHTHTRIHIYIYMCVCRFVCIYCTCARVCMHFVFISSCWYFTFIAFPAQFEVALTTGR